MPCFSIGWVPSFVSTSWPDRSPSSACSFISLVPPASINLPGGSPVVNFGQLMVIPRLLARHLCAASASPCWSLECGLVPGRQAVLTPVVAVIGRADRPRRRRSDHDRAEFVVFYLNQDQRRSALDVRLGRRPSLAMNYALTRSAMGPGRARMAAVGGKSARRPDAPASVQRIYTSASRAVLDARRPGRRVARPRGWQVREPAVLVPRCSTSTPLAAAVIGGTSFADAAAPIRHFGDHRLSRSIASGLMMLDSSSLWRHDYRGTSCQIAVIVDCSRAGRGFPMAGPESRSKYGRRGGIFRGSKSADAARQRRRNVDTRS